jgi:hypothetical protein
VPDENKVNICCANPAAHDDDRWINRADRLIGKTGAGGGK